jgi:hypothetical protein
MTTIIMPEQCKDCENFWPAIMAKSRFGCKAFRIGIPDDIYSGDFDHKKPHQGDNGIQYKKLVEPEEE